ncbi:hypothetical protein D0T49_07140 [Paludibacter sp. 221]|uniref:FKBP-type peptidyl-prolyl cis-trans isomerase N-terminal domain-containing protein n=1 Tax=Paludibacter sp. 221 TaxID=2302939 RepID=UPI0013D4291B|nr:FKBP-type peptidyl-prolyl cis-trans isomerase N-terminal domain-containing protein [Paludibacter sp. 221]NDV46820.1 hypothetical protein [Paludibacter sp. 221]
MKRQLIFTLVTLIAVITMVSCKKYQAQTVTLNDMNDSINYALGYVEGEQIGNYLMASYDDEDAAVKAFIDALDKAYNSNEEPNEMYDLGLNFGSWLKKQETEGLMGEPDLTFNYKTMEQGLKDGLNDVEGTWSIMDAQTYLQNTMRQIQEEKAKANQTEEEVIIEEEIIEAE